MRHLALFARRTWIGFVIVCVAPLAALVLTRYLDPGGEWYTWRSITIALLVIGAMLLALVEELGRPQNPYRHLDPRFAFLDAAPTGKLDGPGSGWLWHAMPPAIAVALIVLSWIVT